MVAATGKLGEPLVGVTGKLVDFWYGRRAAGGKFLKGEEEPAMVLLELCFPGTAPVLPQASSVDVPLEATAEAQ